MHRHPAVSRTLASLCLLAAAGSVSAAGVDFQLFQADGASSTQAEAFCQGDRIVGGVIDSSGSPSGAVMKTGGAVHPFSLPNATVTRPHACYKDKMLGAAFYGEYGFVMKGFVASRGSVLLLKPPGGKNAAVRGMNATGTIVGDYAFGAAGYDAGFIYKDGVYTRYDVPGAAGTDLMGIAEDGTMFGYAIDATTQQTSGFIDQAGTLTTIRVPGSYDTFVTGRNAAGLVVGYFDTAFGGNHLGFYYQDGQYVPFSPDQALDTYVWSVDDQGRAVGYSYYDNYGQSAFVATINP